MLTDNSYFVKKWDENLKSYEDLDYVYTGSDQICLGSDPQWSGSALFTRDRFETGMVRFYMGSPSEVNPFGTR